MPGKKKKNLTSEEPPKRVLADAELPEWLEDVPDRLDIVEADCSSVSEELSRLGQGFGRFRNDAEGEIGRLMYAAERVILKPASEGARACAPAPSPPMI